MFIENSPLRLTCLHYLNKNNYELNWIQTTSLIDPEKKKKIILLSDK